MSDGTGEAPAEGAWNPGLESEIPRRLQPLVTLFRPENAFREHAEARELADLCGLAETELVWFRPERLVVHELLVRVTADLSVPDGPNYEELGINLRGMVATLFERHVMPEMEGIREAFEAERESASDSLDRQLQKRLFGDGAAAGASGEGTRKSAPAARGSLLARLFGEAKPARREPPPSSRATEPRELLALDAWRSELVACDAPLERACLEALVRTVDAIVARRGRLFADQALIRGIALAFVCNERGAELVGELLEPIVERALPLEGYRRLPPRPEPVIMNVKGASASGKSTIRPQQRRLAEQLGIPWEDFALISPDYWRKYLLDYDSLGEDFRYGAMLTGQELEVIDRKLDRYMALKASRGAMSHLLIDRFRFDSFALDQERTDDSRLLSRFGHRVFMFFMVTPPAETVERAWIRGRRTGRYKAVSDLLFHNVEAFTGMPALFLSWVNADDKQVHFEFLDNDVPEGTLPRTAAFGWNGSMTILDVELLLDIDRYRKVNVEARRAEDVFAPDESSAVRNLEFIRRCAAKIATITFADQDTAQVYARVANGRLLWRDEGYLERRDAAGSVRTALDALCPASGTVAHEDDPATPLDLEHERRYTLGRWADAAIARPDRPSAV